MSEKGRKRKRDREREANNPEEGHKELRKKTTVFILHILEDCIKMPSSSIRKISLFEELSTDE